MSSSTCLKADGLTATRLNSSKSESSIRKPETRTEGVGLSAACLPKKQLLFWMATI
jgi:hypothetical protein